MLAARSGGPRGCCRMDGFRGRPWGKCGVCTATETLRLHPQPPTCAAAPARPPARAGPGGGCGAEPAELGAGAQPAGRLGAVLPGGQQRHQQAGAAGAQMVCKRTQRGGMADTWELENKPIP